VYIEKNEREAERKEEGEEEGESTVKE